MTSVGRGGKPKGKPRGKPNRAIKNECPQLKKPERNADSIEFVKEYMSWPMVDMADPEAVRRRALEYLDLCAQYDTKPLVSGLCIVMGTNRDEVTKWAKGQKTSLGYRLSPESSLELQNALANLEVLWEFAMQNNGYRNPVTGIFLGKNNFNYKDISETVIRHESASAGPSRAQLAEKYAAALPAEDVRVEDPDEPKRLSSGD